MMMMMLNFAFSFVFFIEWDLFTSNTIHDEYLQYTRTLYYIIMIVIIIMYLYICIGQSMIKADENRKKGEISKIK